MRKCNKSSSLVRSRPAVSILIIAALLTTIEIPAAAFAMRSSRPAQMQSNLPQGVTRLASASAIASKAGVELRWSTSYEIDNLGFNIYRSEAGRRVQVNRDIVFGSVFIVGDGVPLRGGYSYSHFDSGGSVDAAYFIESVSLSGSVSVFGPVKAVEGVSAPGLKQVSASAVSSNTSSPIGSQREYPAGAAEQVVANGPIEDQWAIAAQSSLKIFIKTDGWYRVSQQQVEGAGFNATVDVRNLRLYADGQETAIRTSKSSGQFSSGDYFEFYGRGLDTPSTDTRTYYLIAGSNLGKRMRGDVQPESDSPVVQPTPTPARELVTPRSKLWFNLVVPLLYGTVFNPPETAAETKAEAPLRTAPLREPLTERVFDTSTIDKPIEEKPLAKAIEEKPVASARVSEEPKTESKRTAKKGKRTKKRKRNLTRRYNHSAAAPALAASFNYTIEKKDRISYFLPLLNGDADNFFGPFVFTNPVIQNLDVKGVETTADGPAHLEVSLQGVSFVNHLTRVSFNDTDLGVVTFFGRDHRVTRFPISMSLLREGINSVRLVQLGGSNDACFLDSVRLTYPRAFKADNDSLRFSLRSTQPSRIDGFSTQNVRLIDYSDPFSVTISRPIVETSGSGYAIAVPASVGRAKSGRLLYAIPENQVQQPAGFALNQPSTLNQASNGADLVIISHRDFLQNVAPLADFRRSQGLTVSVVDVEDIYDEFSFGAHGPRAIRDFLARANSIWTSAPRYVIFVGDAIYDPRNHEGRGNFDFVPTKLVDATYNETASDDWFADFDNDGIADIPVGRLPVRTSAEATLVVSKIISFLPANVPQSAFLVADDPTGYYFNFEVSNDQVQTLVSPSLTVHRLNRRTETSDAVARANIIAKFNQGQALVNYTGHGNVDVWTGGAIFRSQDAFALTNGNKLPFVVVMDCLNGYFHDTFLVSMSESLLKAPSGGAVAAFASSGLTLPEGQHAMSQQLYILLYGGQSIPLGDAIKTAKAATTDIDVRRTWIFFGDPSMKIR